MRTRFRTLLLTGAALLGMAAIPASAANVTLDGVPASKLGNYKITCSDVDNSAASPCFVQLSGSSTVTANQGAAGSQPWLVQDGTDGPGTNPGTGARGWLSGIYAYQITQLAALQAANSRALIGADFNGNVAAGSTGVGTIRTPGTAYTKFTVIASCVQAGTLTLRASDDNFTTSTQIATASVPTGSYSASNTPSAGAGQITVPNAFANYVALVSNTNSTAGTCVIKSTATTN